MTAGLMDRAHRNREAAWLFFTSLAKVKHPRPEYLAKSPLCLLNNHEENAHINCSCVSACEWPAGVGHILWRSAGPRLWSDADQRPNPDHNIIG